MVRSLGNGVRIGRVIWAYVIALPTLPESMYYIMDVGDGQVAQVTTGPTFVKIAIADDRGNKVFTGFSNNLKNLIGR